jgi:GNAT superfamily N-acetyltransferase
MNPSPQTTPTPAEQPRWSETLRDHSHVVIRPLGKLDKQAEREFIEGLSSEARRFRFMGQISSPSEQLLEQLTNIDYVHDMAFAAVIQEGAHERIVGVSRYSTDADASHSECAVTVSDEWQNKGLGSSLMRHLIEVARTHGVRAMRSVDSAENTQMADLARFLGFHSRMDPSDASQVIHELEL